MSRFFKALLILATVISCSPKETTQKVSFKQVEFQIPAEWKHNVEELEKNFVYQITSTDSLEINLFMIGWIESELEPEMYIDVMKQGLLEESDDVAYEFGDYENEKFMGADAIRSQIKAKTEAYEATGKIYVFKKYGKSYFILIQGSSYFFESKSANKILSSLKIQETK